MCHRFATFLAAGFLLPLSWLPLFYWHFYFLLAIFTVIYILLPTKGIPLPFVKAGRYRSSEQCSESIMVVFFLLQYLTEKTIGRFIPSLRAFSTIFL